MWFVSEKKYKRLLEENEDLKNLYNNLKVRFISLWIRDILKVFGEEQPDNCTVPIKIPYFKHNKEFNNVVSCGFLPKEGKAGYIPTEEIIIPELHIIVRGI